MMQWLQFQNTAHGPVLQHVFHWSFLDTNPPAHAYYVAQFRRILKVLDNELNGKDWLVGGKCSAADLSFFSFQSRMGFIMGNAAPDLEAEFANVDAWYKRILERPKVEKVLGDHHAELKRLNLLSK